MPNIVLTGFSGTGKSRVGQAVAHVLGWAFVDTDDEVARRAGKPIPRIFQEEGEAHFRELERPVLQEALAQERRVVATGGGAVADSANRALMLSRGFLVCLEARPEAIHRRLADDRGGSARPLLAGPDPREQIRVLKEKRQPAYAQAHWTIHTDTLSVEEVARKVVRAWRLVSAKEEAPFTQEKRASAGEKGDAVEREKASLEDDPNLAAIVEASSGSYPVLVGWNLLPRLGECLQKAGIGGPVYLISDSRVTGLYGRVAQRALQEADIEAHTFTFPAGEESKSLEMATRLYGWLAERRAERGHTLVAMGGGVVGDLTGFVAATYNRGMGFVQVPTSMAAMVDASIGGKTAVNLPAAKNLVGAFYQPRLVVADVACLRSLPRRETMEGWAEAIKHGLILDRELLETFEQEADRLLALEPEVTTDVIRRSVAIKARVVSEDERETTGFRTLLNYGHTIGHGLEAATDYGRFLHGEGVSVGMMGAALIARALGLLPAEAVERQESLLRRFDLPVRCPGVDLPRVELAMALDKKTQAGAIRWVLLEEVGRAVLRSDVPATLVREVLDELAREES